MLRYKRQMLWKGMAERSWSGLVQQWGVPQVEALQLQKSIASLMREVGPKLGDLHWKESTGFGKEGRVLPEETLSMLEAARDAMRLRIPGWCGEKGQGRWSAKRLLQWAAKELATSRRDLDLQFGDIQDWAQREAMERRMGDSLLRWLRLDKPPQQRVRHKVWRKQLTDSTRQLRLGADRAMQGIELEMLDGTELYSVAEEAAAGSVVRGPSPGAGSEPAAGEGEWEGKGWEDGSGGNWVEGAGAGQEEVEVGIGADAEAEAGARAEEAAPEGCEAAGRGGEEAAAAGLEAPAEFWWEVIYGSTVEGAALSGTECGTPGLRCNNGSGWCKW